MNQTDLNDYAQDLTKLSAALRGFRLGDLDQRGEPIITGNDHARAITLVLNAIEATVSLIRGEL